MKIEIGSGFLTFLALLFITLKLIGKIDWSWWIVLLPIWGPVVLGLIFLLVCLVVGLVFVS